MEASTPVILEVVPPWFQEHCGKPLTKTVKPSPDLSSDALAAGGGSLDASGAEITPPCLLAECSRAGLQPFVGQPKRKYVFAVRDSGVDER